jgi:hypothetical protein
MNAAQFVALTASDAWLTASEICALLDAGGYWPIPYQHLPSRERLAHVALQLGNLKDDTGKPLFEQIPSLGSDGQTIMRYKQARLIRRDRNIQRGDG